MQQHTLNKPLHFEGYGLHTGKFIHMDILPADANHGIRISRVDLPDNPTYPAVADYVSATERGTVLENGEWRVSTVEHVLSALSSMGVDNVLIQVDAPEIPILDGSARLYVEAINNAGIYEQDAERQIFVVRNKIEFTRNNSRLILLPDDHYSVDVLVNYDSPILGNQFAQLDDINCYADDIASARTFCFVREVEPLLDLGLIKGGNLDNALVIYDRPIEQSKLDRLADICHVHHLPADHLGYLSELKYSNEPARHKLLDVLGDLTLVGCPIQGKVIATCPGHGVNTAFAKMIRKELKNSIVQAPHYDPNQKPVYDINEIRALLPHRYPMLLVDKIIYKSKHTIVGVKNTTNNEPYFQGHFPNEPIVPGVIIIETMAQIGGLFALTDDHHENTQTTYLLKIDKTKFRHKIQPGDTMIIRMDLLEPIRRGIIVMRGSCFVGNLLAAETELVVQVGKVKGEK